MKDWVYRIAGVYHIVAGLMLSVTIFFGAVVVTKNIFFQHHVKVDHLSLGSTLLVLMVMLIVCLVAIKAGLLLLRKDFHGVRLGVVVQLSQLVSLVTPFFVYSFHFPYSLGVMIYKTISATGSQFALMPISLGQALFHAGAPKPIEGVWAPIQYAVCVNLVALLFLTCFIIMWRQEKSSSSMLGSKQNVVA